MTRQSTATATGAVFSARAPAMSVDDAVRAALRHRPAETRAFGNEDDMEGPRSESLDVRTAPPAP
jgi:hypothetical protein